MNILGVGTLVALGTFIVLYRKSIVGVFSFFRALGWSSTKELILLKIRLKLLDVLGIGILRELPNQTYEVSYVHGLDLYKFRFPKKLNRSYSMIKTGESNCRSDVTNQIKMLAGPNKDFYGFEVTPDMLNFENLTVFYKNGSNLTFDKFEKVSIYPPPKTDNSN